jgi:hypothetical protein
MNNGSGDLRSFLGGVEDPRRAEWIRHLMPTKSSELGEAQSILTVLSDRDLVVAFLMRE